MNIRKILRNAGLVSVIAAAGTGLGYGIRTYTEPPVLQKADGLDQGKKEALVALAAAKGKELKEAPKKDNGAPKKALPKKEEELELFPTPPAPQNVFDSHAMTADQLRNDSFLRGVIIDNAQASGILRQHLLETVTHYPDVAPYVANSVARGTNLSRDGKFTAGLKRAYQAFIKQAETKEDAKDTLLGVLRNPDLVMQAPVIDRLTRTSPLRKDGEFTKALAAGLKAAKAK